MSDIDELEQDFKTAALKAAEEAFGDVASVMKDYPPKRPNQKYVRTFTFMRAWHVQRKPKYTQITNYAEQRGVNYAGYVVGNALGYKQAWMHAGRWKSFRKLIDLRFEKINESVKKWFRLESKFVE